MCSSDLNTATASALGPDDVATGSNASSTSTAIAQTTALQVTKTATVGDVDGDFKTDLGDTITWSFLVKNTGTVTVTGLGISDATAGAVSCPATTLAPGAQTTCTATTPHTVTQADVDAGVVSNTATASATPAGGGTVTSPPSSTDTPVAQSSGLTLVKSAAVTDVHGDGSTDLGDTIRWSFVVRNSGTTT